MRRSLWLSCCVLCIIFLARPAFAETIHLKSGKVITGEVIEKTADHIKMNVEGINVTYWTEDIQTDNAPSASAAKKEEKSNPPAMLSSRDVYKAYTAALGKNDWAGMKPYLTKENIRQKEAAAAGGAPSLAGGKKFVDNSYTVARDADRKDGGKVLVAIGNIAAGKARNIVMFIQEDGAWKIESDKWAMGERKTEAMPIPANTTSENVK